MNVALITERLNVFYNGTFEALAVSIRERLAVLTVQHFERLTVLIKECWKIRSNLASTSTVPTTFVFNFNWHYPRSPPPFFALGMTSYLMSQSAQSSDRPQFSEFRTHRHTQIVFMMNLILTLKMRRHPFLILAFCYHFFTKRNRFVQTKLNGFNGFETF